MDEERDKDLLYEIARYEYLGSIFVVVTEIVVCRDTRQDGKILR